MTDLPSACKVALQTDGDINNFPNSASVRFGRDSAMTAFGGWLRVSFAWPLLAPHHAIAMFSRAKVSLMAMERSLRT